MTCILSFFYLQLPTARQWSFSSVMKKFSSTVVAATCVWVERTERYEYSEEMPKVFTSRDHTTSSQINEKIVYIKMVKAVRNECFKK